MIRFCAVGVLGALSALRSASALRSRSHVARVDLESYSFERFGVDFERNYIRGTQEYNSRAALFEQSLKEIRAVNAKNVEEGRSWVAGIHPFMDWTTAERKTLNGYKPMRTRGPAGAFSLLHQRAEAKSHARGSMRLNMTHGGTFAGDLSPALRQQGNCGSCWAISAVEAVEAQLLKSGVNQPIRLSAQALVDCVPNPRHCGGTGGCEGATGELAYAYMKDYGIPLESDLPYRAKTGTCSGAWQSSKRARVSGWTQLPSNQAEPLMQALIQDGPVVVAVDANNWFNYDSGIFDSCDKDAILGHAVLAKGYGTDVAKRYWLIQNSWGSGWGEEGHIRMLMHDDEDQWCGTDRKPSEGVGCDGGPSEVTVCGMCGILYDPLIPTGVRLESGDDTQAAVAISDTTAATIFAPDHVFRAETHSIAASDMTFGAQSATSDVFPASSDPGQSAVAQMDALLHKIQSG